MLKNLSFIHRQWLSLKGFEQGSTRLESGFGEDLFDLSVGRWTIKGGGEDKTIRRP